MYMDGSFELIQKFDPEIAQMTLDEEQRQLDTLCLIASENYASPVTVGMEGTVWANKNAEGYPGRRFAGGCEIADKVEELAKARCKELFGCEYVNVQSMSSTLSNVAVLRALLKPGDTILSMELDQGGHLSHGAKFHYSGKMYNVVQYGLNKETETIDMEQVERLAKECKPKLIICGTSSYPRKVDYKWFGEIAKEVGAYMMADIAHPVGLIAAGVIPSPVPYADVVTTSTHKTFRGPRGCGIIMCRAELGKKMDQQIFPGMQGAPKMDMIASRAVLFKECMTDEYKEYQKQVAKNAVALADELQKCGLRLVSGGTETHLVLVDIRELIPTGREAEEVLGSVGIVVNKNMIPYDPQPANLASGIRIGSPALTMAPKVRMNEAERIKKQESIDRSVFLRDTVRELFRTMLSPLKIPLAIFDFEERLVYKSKDYPEYCKRTCGIEEDLRRCPLIQRENFWVPPYYEGASACVCQHGLWVYSFPIVSRGEFLGYIKAGHVRTDNKEKEEGLPYNVPESTVAGIVQVIHKLAEAICNHYQICQMQVDLHHKVRILSDREKEEEILQESLKTSQDHAFNLQINQHFLFNTLNTIAGLAIREGAVQTYQAIGDLAQLFRYTLRTSDYFVTVREEIEYLRNYTNLQKLRFGKRLEVVYEISPKVWAEKVPFNFLQPIAENSFRHGFKNKKGNICLTVRGEKKEGAVSFTIQDNGAGMGEEELSRLREKIKKGNGAHGTVMVARKLESLYGDSFAYSVSASEKGTTVTVRIPTTEGGEGDETNIAGRR